LDGYACWHQSGHESAVDRRGFLQKAKLGLAASTGVTSGAFYSSFSSKEELFREVIDAHLGKIFPDMELQKIAMAKLEETIVEQTSQLGATSTRGTFRTR
jgi:hypothetical protein